MTTIDIDQLTFRPLRLHEASTIASWRYEPPYDIYNIDRADIVDEAGRMVQLGYFGAFTASGELIAFRCFGKDGQVSGFNYDDSAVDTGGGLRPQLTGRGIGTTVIEAGLRFGRSQFGDCDFRTTVANFNSRAQRVLARISFKLEARFTAESGIDFVVLRQSF